jgi:DNA-binding HxlR family transcriptional regulator
MKISKEEVSILRLLQTNGEMAGLSMVYAAPGILKRGTIYVTLDQMEEKGWLVSRMSPPTEPFSRPLRRHYSITPLGAVIHADGVLAAQDAE